MPARRAAGSCSWAVPQLRATYAGSLLGNKEGTQEIEAGQSAEAGVGPPPSPASGKESSRGLTVRRVPYMVPRGTISPSPARPGESVLFLHRSTGQNVWALSHPVLPLKRRPQQQSQHLYPGLKLLLGHPAARGHKARRPGPSGATCSKAGQNGDHTLAPLDMFYDLEKAPSPHFLSSVKWVTK